MLLDRYNTWRKREQVMQKLQPGKVSRAMKQKQVKHKKREKNRTSLIFFLSPSKGHEFFLLFFSWLPFSEA